MLKTMFLAGVACCGLSSAAMAGCIWSRELSAPHHHPIFCTTPDDPDLARILGHIGAYEVMREIELDARVYLIERRPDGIIRRTEPYRLLLKTERRRANA